MTENIFCEYGPNYYPKHKKAKEINNFLKKFDWEQTTFKRKDRELKLNFKYII